MKRTYLATTAIALMLAAPVLAQTGSSSGSTATPSTSGTTTTQPVTPGTSPSAAAPSATGGNFATSVSADQQRADRIIGMDLRNSQDQDLGEISDLIVDKSGSVKQVVLSVGGFLGIGDKLVAVDWNQIQIDPQRRVAVANMTKEQLQQAPGFKYPDEVRTGAGDATAPRTGTGAGTTTMPTTTPGGSNTAPKQ